MGCGASKEAGSGATAEGATTTVPKDAGPMSTVFGAFREPTITLQRISNHATKLGTVGKAVTKGARDAAHHVRNVFATPLELIFDLDSYRIPVNEKSRDEKQLIESALKRNFVFEHLDPRERNPLILAFEPYSVPEGEVIIKQGDAGNYFYIIKKGRCGFEVDGRHVGEAKAGDSFGELALLYNCPRAATVTALEATDLFRVDQNAFRFIMQNETKKGSEEKVNLLRGVDFLKDLSEADLTKLANVMTPHKFKAGDYLVRKGEAGDEFFIIQEGTLKAVDISVGDIKYGDIEVKPGMSVGEAALATGKPRAASVIANTDGVAFKIDGKTFVDVLGSLNHLIARSLDKVKLAGIKLFADSNLDTRTITSMAKLFQDEKFESGKNILKSGEDTEAALYFVRQGVVEMTDSDAKHRIEPGGYFGIEMIELDRKTGKGGRTDPSTIKAPYDVAVVEDCVCGVMTLRDLRAVLNTCALGTGQSVATQSFKVKNITMSDLERHKVLGAGTFGQVWLVSTESSGKKHAYALKIQSKYELVKDGQAKAVVNEKNIMEKLKHPFLCHLVSSFQDEAFVYMLMNILQGGELYSVIHTKRRDGVPDSQAKFYAAAIADGLGHMHKRGYVYRDLKPENVMLDSQGYTVIVDFGFAKYVPDKTYTLCGTPLYLPPEIILNRGHNQAADHWSMGVLIYEMCTGGTLFYQEGMEQIDLFRAIVKGRYTLPTDMNADAADLITGLVNKDLSQRLGSLRGGEDDIFKHPWFSSIDFEKLVRKEIKAPYVPKIKNPLDASNFEDWAHLKDKTQETYPKLTAEQARIFDEF